MKKWPTRRLGDFISESTARLGKAPATIFSVTNSHGFVRSLDRFDKQVFSANVGNYKRVQHLDLAYNPSRINVGSVALCDEQDGGAVSPMYVIVRCLEGLLPSYLLRYLKSDTGARQIRHRCEGAVRFQLKFRDLCQIPLPIPPLLEQERIVSLLDEVDELRKLRAQADKRMADFIPALFNEMFGDPVTNPKGWPVKRLDEICTVVSGLWVGKRPPFMAVNVIRNTNFRGGGRLNLADVARLQVEERQFHARTLKPGDLILEKSGGSPKQPVGRVTRFDVNEGEWSFSNFTSRIRVLDDNQIVSYYLWTFLNQQYDSGRTLVMQSQTTGIRNLNLNAYKTIHVPLPPLALQQDFTERISALQEVEEAQTSSCESAETSFQSMLHRAFDGEL